jgi:branched-chain amino acid transport system substrate-binding protein
MRGSGSGRRMPLGRTAAAGVLGLLLFVATACGGDDSSNSKSTTTTAAGGGTTATTVSTASLLGANAAATGTPVKVGLITNGGACAGCGNQDEEPVAKATVNWLNAHQKGLAGHPITLDVCVDANDPGKTSDCANQMIRDNVAAVIMGTSGVIETSWTILHNAKIPVINSSTTNTAMLVDKTSTYILNDPVANTIAFPISVAKAKGVKKISIIVIDVPAATDIYKTKKSEFGDAGLDVTIVPVALGTPDMTPQAQQIESNNPGGLVMIVGHDQFCIPAIQGLSAVGFHGPIATISYCVTDAMRKALPGKVEGIQFSSIAALGDNTNQYMRQYQAVLDAYAKGKNIDRESAIGVGIFQSLGALNSGTKGLTGTVTPASVNTAMHSMKNETLLASGINFRCNGKASPDSPSVCSAGVLAATLDAQGQPAKYDVVNNKPIPG